MTGNTRAACRHEGPLTGKDWRRTVKSWLPKHRQGDVSFIALPHPRGGRGRGRTVGSDRECAIQPSHRGEAVAAGRREAGRCQRVDWLAAADEKFRR